MTKIASVVGARPQFIKAAMVSRRMRANGKLKEILIHTGQHYDEEMSRVFFEELGIPEPDYNLEVGSGSHGAQTGQMLERIEEVLLREKPVAVLVYGDTNSTLAGALAAVKLHIPVGHVEAGLRSFNRRMPEEINRVLTDLCSEWLFAPTETAVQNLRKEGAHEEKVFLVGDVMHDAARYYAGRAGSRSSILPSLGAEPGRYILATIHRAENTDDPDRLRAIFEGLGQVTADCLVVVPLHPRTGNELTRLGWKNSRPDRLKITDPVGYLDMITLEKNALLVVTDSGGVQKEAFFYRVPCLTFRGETEWTELVELGWNRTVLPASSEVVQNAVREVLAAGPGREAHPYGRGDSANRIVEILVTLSIE